MMIGVHELSPILGAGAACRALGLPRGVPARQRAQVRRLAWVGPRLRRAARPRPPLALDALESQVLLDTLNSERFVDTAPAAVHATLLDEGRYLGSVRTMYRVLAANGSCRERRNQLTHPAYTKPELFACAQSGLVVGHHEAQGAGEVDVLPPLRDPGHEGLAPIFTTSRKVERAATQDGLNGSPICVSTTVTVRVGDDL